MRDKEGRTLSNAHILGFLWRILKLIHYGIRPIFVFDGGAPVMKRQTLVGRRQRKAGAKDSHQRVAERLLNARLREAAVAHVAGGGASTSTANQGSTFDAAAVESHGLGQNTVYFDDLTTTVPSSANAKSDVAGWVDVANGGEAAGETDETEAQKRKKRNDWHKDPYALPALERDINTMTAANSTATKNARGGGKRQDVRFATEGELRALLSSIGPTDLDLDSDFFRSLPSELQYELVGDMRAASRGTSYKRLQAMLSQSPTPIDFSRAQIAGLKTRNELTQKVLEVTDEIGDAHIKVPIRVAGARNREYVLVRNKGDQGGFALGVRGAGTSQDKAIAVDEDTASATTDDDLERRTTDEEIDLEVVPIQPSPEKSKRETDESVPPALLKANPNDPVARREVAKELLQRRARALAKEKATAQGCRNDGEEMEEQLRRVRAAQRKLERQGQKRNRAKSSAPRQGALFRGAKTAQRKASTKLAPMESVDTEEEDEDEEGQDEEWDDLLDQQEAIDLGRALDESEKVDSSNEKETVDEEDSCDLELEEVPTHAIDAIDYSIFYTAKPQSNSTSDGRMPTWITAGQASSSMMSSATPVGTESSPTKLAEKHLTTSEEMDPRLQNKKRYVNDDESEPEKAISVHSSSSLTSSPVLPAAAKMKWDPKHTRVISISDSDASVEEVPSQQTNSISSADIVTIRTEQSNHRDGGGSEIKVVDFQDKTIDDPARNHSETEEEVVAEQDSAPTLTRSKGSDHESELAQAPSPDAELAVAAKEDSIGADVATPRDVERDESLSDVAANMLEYDEDDDSEPPVGAARLNESALSHANLLEMEEEELESQTGEKVTLDNVSSRAVEAGEYPRMYVEEQEPELDAEQSDQEEVEEGRDSEDEHSDYSNKGFGRNGFESDLDEEDMTQPQITLGPDGFPLPSAEELAAMDAEDEAELGEMANDQDEFVSFLSRAKGQGLNQVRKEVEDEVNQLRSEHATTRRTEGEVTIQMAKEIQFMLRLFGLPYITAPMEAEAQCAELIQLKLADGIITDDSDVFLFGGTFVYKNMFNNKKYVECYKLADLQHDLGMDRAKLVQLAYLLGSDYTEGLEGVGPVLAMEILSHFPGEDGLVKFREWWRKVQMGKDTAKDTYDSVLKRLKKTLRNKVHLESHWPDPNVIDAYFEPTVDSSKETFQWGLPDLDSLRSFFKEYLRWDQEKTDHYLLPAIEAQNRRSKGQGNQTTLDRANFFDLKAGEGAFAGREKPKYHSNRLQQIVNGFRASNTKKADGKKDKGTIDVVTLSDEEEREEQDEGDLPKESRKKAMGKKPRPVARKKAKVTPKEVEKDASGKQRQRGKRKARETSPADSIHDQEWRPAKAKKPSRARQAKRLGVTSLSQARNMSLDSIANLPPSRVGSRHRADSQVEQQSIVLTNDEDESSLTEQE